MLVDTSAFIDAGWHTIPHIAKSIVRDETGRKQFKLPKGWDKYKEDFNELPTPVGSVIPGIQSNLIVIDCDTTEATEVFESMLPEYKAVTYGVGKLTQNSEPIRSSNWFFNYTPNIPLMHNGEYGLEVFNGEKDTQQVFLPTVGNTTKTPWASIPKLINIPSSIVTLLNVWAKASKPATVKMVTSSGYATGQHTFQLAPMVEKQLTRDTILPALFSIITPSIFRNDLYRSQGYLHPNDIKDGQGNDYMIRIAAILGSDDSISKDLFTRIMHYINSLWESPYSKREIDSRISRMTSGESRVGDMPIWRYDKNWEHARFMDHNKVEHLVEYYLDPAQLEIVEVNHTTLTTRVLKKGIPAAIALLTTKGDDIKGKSKIETFQRILPAMTSIVDPSKPFGPLPEDKFSYNTFRRSPAVEIIHAPDAHDDLYIEPTTFIKYMESLVPVEADRIYLLRHLVTKLKTFNYSPVVYYFVGAPGSGKGLFTKLVSTLMGGEQYVGLDLGSSEILGATNGWLEGLFFAHFDELHDTLGKYEDRKKANGNIKKWSGSDTFQLRKMHCDSVTSKMLATFILTQNGSSFNMDMGDRRYLYMNTPTPLSEVMNTEEVVASLKDDILNIAYYLQKTYEQLPIDEYVAPPMTDDKLESIMDKQPKHLVILDAINRADYDRLYQLVIDSGIEMTLFTEHRSKDLIYQDALVDLYIGLTGLAKPVSEILGLFKSAIKHGALKGQPSGAKMYHNNQWTITAHGFSDTCEPLDTIDDGLQNIKEVEL